MRCRCRARSGAAIQSVVSSTGIGRAMPKPCTCAAAQVATASRVRPAFRPLRPASPAPAVRPSTGWPRPSFCCSRSSSTLGDEAAVDLQPAHRKAPDRGDRGMAGAKIVQIDAAAQSRKRRDIRHDHVIVGLGHHGFQDFDRQPLRRQVEAVQLPFQLVRPGADCAIPTPRKLTATVGTCSPPRSQRPARSGRCKQHHLAQPFRSGRRPSIAGRNSAGGIRPRSG